MAYSSAAQQGPFWVELLSALSADDRPAAQQAGAALGLRAAAYRARSWFARPWARVAGGKIKKRLASHLLGLNDWLADVKQAASPVTLWAQAVDEIPLAQSAHDSVASRHAAARRPSSVGALAICAQTAPRVSLIA